MMVAKGQLMPDKSYRYTCGCCGGSGHYGAEDCSWCYGLDVERIASAMKEGVRGERYYGLLKAFLSVKGKALVDEFRRVKAEQGKFTPVDIGYLSLWSGLNFKATCEWLEETGCIASGTYDRFSDSKLKVRDLYAAARNEYPVLVKGEQAS